MQRDGRRAGGRGCDGGTCGLADERDAPVENLGVEHAYGPCTDLDGDGDVDAPAPPEVVTSVEPSPQTAFTTSRGTTAGRLPTTARCSVGTVQVTVQVVVAGAGRRPAPGTPVRVELRDVTEQDAPSVLLAGVDAEVAEGDTPTIATVTLEAADDLVVPRADVVAWARVAVSGAERTTREDLVSTRSVVVPPGPAARVELPVVEV